MLNASMLPREAGELPYALDWTIDRAPVSMAA